MSWYSVLTGENIKHMKAPQIIHSEGSYKRCEGFALGYSFATGGAQVVIIDITGIVVGTVIEDESLIGADFSGYLRNMMYGDEMVSREKRLKRLEAERKGFQLKNKRLIEENAEMRKKLSDGES